ncbi:MAG: hypothetical protein MI919_40565, partial [Holophagales bacterium]|nr:hypothetical protein [Holophagales bacterium]
MVALPASADLCFFGYTGAIDTYQRVGSTVTFNQWLTEQKSTFGIDVDTGIVFSPFEYELLRDAFPAVVQTFSSQSTKMILDLGNLIFDLVTTGTADCTDYRGGPSEPATTAKSKSTFYPDWQARLADFAATAAPLVSPSNTELIIVHGEINNRCIRSWQVNTASRAIQALFPGIPVLGVYEIRSDDANAQGLPTIFPKDLDHVGFFSFGVFNPNNPQHPKNHVIKPFYNPNNPLGTGTQWGDFLSRVRPNQKVDATLEAYYSSRQVGHGWSQADLGTVATHWNSWVASQPRIHGMAAFKWTSNPAIPDVGVRDLPASVGNSHAAVAASIVSCP